MSAAVLAIGATGGVGGAMANLSASPGSGSITGRVKPAGSGRSGLRAKG